MTITKSHTSGLACRVRKDSLPPPTPLLPTDQMYSGFRTSFFHPGLARAGNGTLDRVDQSSEAQRILSLRCAADVSCSHAWDLMDCQIWGGMGISPQVGLAGISGEERRLLYSVVWSVDCLLGSSRHIPPNHFPAIMATSSVGGTLVALVLFLWHTV